MSQTLADGIERVLESQCGGMCLDNEEERRKVAQTIAFYIQEVNKDDSGTEKRSPGADERR
jgi:hypothetical protein